MFNIVLLAFFVREKENYAKFKKIEQKSNKSNSNYLIWYCWKGAQVKSLLGSVTFYWHMTQKTWGAISLRKSIQGCAANIGSNIKKIRCILTKGAFAHISRKKSWATFLYFFFPKKSQLVYEWDIHISFFKLKRYTMIVTT